MGKEDLFQVNPKNILILCMRHRYVSFVLGFCMNLLTTPTTNIGNVGSCDGYIDYTQNHAAELRHILNKLAVL